MIIYFSASGNSKFIAETLAQSLGDSLISINEILKSQGKIKAESALPWVFVFPIHAWNIPNEVTRVISEGAYSGSRDSYFVFTMGGSAGKTAKFCAAIAREKGLDYLGSSGILMPDDYIPYMKTNDENENRKLVEAGRKSALALAERIKKRETITYHDKAHAAWLLSGYVHNMFSKYSTDSKLYVKDSCVGCGSCVMACPKNNIRLEGGKPHFLGNCMGCLACLNICPEEALERKGQSEGHPRYRFPKLD